jgi:hypothetical protein
MMHNRMIRNGYDLEGMRRVAAVMLRHVRPESRGDAFTLLDEKLGVFIFDRTALAAEIDRYFGDRGHLAA